jgi:hypothetical protein
LYPGELFFTPFGLIYFGLGSRLLSKMVKKPQKEGIPFLNPPENASLYFKTNSSLSGAGFNGPIKEAYVTMH